MARKPMASAGDKVIVEGIDNPLEVLEVARAQDIMSPIQPVGRRKRDIRRIGYAYKLKLARVKPRWFMEHEIEYVVHYMPLTMDVRRHVDFVQELGGYEMLRDFLATLPHGKRRGRTGRYYRGGHPVAELMKLVEWSAKLAEGDSQERVDAEAEIISIMQ